MADSDRRTNSATKSAGPDFPISLAAYSLAVGIPLESSVAVMCPMLGKHFFPDYPGAAAQRRGHRPVRSQDLGPAKLQTCPADPFLQLAGRVQRRHRPMAPPRWKL